MLDQAYPKKNPWTIGLFYQRQTFNMCQKGILKCETKDTKSEYTNSQVRYPYIKDPHMEIHVKNPTIPIQDDKSSHMYNI